MSRSSVFGPLLQQAHNGQVLDQTIWNYHYAELKDDLLTNGHYLLDRLARRSSGELLELHLQTARDVSYNREFHERYPKYRSDLDRKRVVAIVEYMRSNHPNITFTVRIIDPAPVGMSGIEAARSYREITNTSIGVLPRELLGGLDTYLRTPGGSTAAADPAASQPVTQGAGASAGSFGPEATSGASEPAIPALPEPPMVP